jgi:glycosyltransferase involved in cell wall biosynthesis
MPKISACIITYNQEKYITECIESALMQQLSCDYEIVIGDDCSNDKTSKICQSYANKYPQLIHYNRRNVNLGMRGNWQETINNCSGDYIAICEGDDYWTDSFKLQKQLDFLESKREYSLCFHPAKILMTNGKLEDEFEISIPKNFHQLEDMARFGNYIRTPTVMFRNILTEEDLNSLRKYPAVDFPLYLILGQYGNYGYVGDSMSVYRQGVGIWSTLDNIQSVLGFTITIIHAKEYFLNKEDYITAEILNEKISFFISSIHNDLKMNDLEPYLNDKVILKELLATFIDIKKEDKRLRPLYGFVNFAKIFFNLLIVQTLPTKLKKWLNY